MTPQSLGWVRSGSEGEACKGAHLGEVGHPTSAILILKGLGGIQVVVGPKDTKLVICVGSEGCGQKANHLADGSNLDDWEKETSKRKSFLVATIQNLLAFIISQIWKTHGVWISKGSAHFHLKGAWGPF